MKIGEKILILAVALLCPVCLHGEITGHITDALTHEELPFANIALGTTMAATADANGFFRIKLPADSTAATLTASYVGYMPLSMRVADGTVRDFALLPSATALHEVVVTAKEGRSLASSSTINRDAMEHVQPTSFADLLALLPGGSTANPVMSEPTHIRLREAGLASDQYDTGALGTRFVVDGAPIITDADMQTVRGEMTGTYGRKTSVNAGVDMRSLPTDNIESVEIIRGVPSVKYGEATSGVVVIKRRITPTPFEGRFKADYYGKLAAVAKGFTVGSTTLMADLGFLDSRADPRDRYNNFRRISASLRADHDARDLRLTVGLDYSGNIDKEKNDPDVQTLPEDTYRSSNHDVAFNSTIIWTPRGGKGVVRSVDFAAGASIAFERLERTRHTQLDRDRVAVTTYEPGVSDGVFLPYNYIASLTVDGKPFNAFATLAANMAFITGAVAHAVVAGADWQLSKNFGEGEIYDLLRPLSPYSSSTRPRRFCDIPAIGQLSAYAEDEATAAIGASRATVRAGLRLSGMPGLDSRYYIHGRVFADPRANVQWTFPPLSVGGHALTADLSAGIGMMTKMPTASHLYPDNVYIDFTQLNHWNADATLRRVNVRTYVENPTNYDLRPARNFKREIRLGLSYRSNHLSITLFRENMTSGFRSVYRCAPYTFRRYDASGIDAATLTGPPALDALAFVPDTVLSLYSTTANGSRTFKEGIEFTFASRRLPHINTRITINGAWFRTRYENSLAGFQSANSTTVIGNVPVNNKYMGYYEWSERYVRERFSTNFSFDTDVPSLGLRFSITPECTWFTASKNDPINGVPTAYMDVTGTMHEYTAGSQSDPWLATLVRKYNDTSFRRSLSPFYMYVNFKATKTFGRHLKAALFIDRLIDVVNDYYRNGMLVRRSGASPYFGMEIKISL